MNTIESEDMLGITFCKRQKLSIERGEGSYVWDEQGRKYLDMTSGWGVTCLGHSHPLIINSVIEQSKKIIQNPNSGFTYSPARARLLQKLTRVLPPGLENIFFSSSGAEANDAALKLARKISGRSKVISMLGSFHGRTYNTLAVSTGHENTQKYLPRDSQTSFVALNNITALENELDEDTAAVILEPIQGEGGVRMLDGGYLRKLSSLCQQFGVLLIIDEIQTGFCRTGHFFAIAQHQPGIKIDILTMGKGIAGGFPFAAFAVSGDLNSKISLGDHGGTYCGNPLGCAIAADVVDYLDSHKIAGRVLSMGDFLQVELAAVARKHSHVIDSIRGEGLLWALQLYSDTQVDLLTSACMERGLLVTPTRDKVLRLIPSLLIEKAELKQALHMLDSALSSVVPEH